MKSINIFFRVLLIIVLTFLISSCKKSDSAIISENITDNNTLSYKVGDTLHSTGTIRLDGHNDCLDGFNNYKIYADKINVPFCSVEGPNKLITKCLPNTFKKDGVRIKFSAVVLPVPSDVKLNCGLIEVLEIDLLK